MNSYNFSHKIIFRSHLLCALIISIIGCFYGRESLKHHSTWYDETHTVYYLHSDSFMKKIGFGENRQNSNNIIKMYQYEFFNPIEIFQRARRESPETSTGYFYFSFLVSSIAAIFNSHLDLVSFLRHISIVLAFISFILIYIISAKHWGKNWGLICLILSVSNPLLWPFFTEARMYSLIILLSLLIHLIVLNHKLLTGRSFYFFIFLSFFGLWTHTFFSLVIISNLCFFYLNNSINAPREKIKWSILIFTIISFIFIFLALHLTQKNLVFSNMRFLWDQSFQDHFLYLKNALALLIFSSPEIRNFLGPFSNYLNATIFLVLISLSLFNKSLSITQKISYFLLTFLITFPFIVIDLLFDANFMSVTRYHLSFYLYFTLFIIPLSLRWLPGHRSLFLIIYFFINNVFSLAAYYKQKDWWTRYPDYFCYKEMAEYMAKEKIENIVIAPNIAQCHRGSIIGNISRNVSDKQNIRLHLINPDIEENLVYYSFDPKNLQKEFPRAKIDHKRECICGHFFTVMFEKIR